MSESQHAPLSDARAFSVPCGRVRHVLLLRHGETDWNAEWRIQSHTDVSINARGREQVAWAAARLVEARTAHPDLDVEVWSSPIRRAVQSADLVRDALAAAGSDPGAVRQHDALGEFAMGSFTGRTLQELRGDPSWEAYVQAPDQATFPGGESMPAIWDRVERGLAEVVAGSSAALLVVVSHGGVIRALLTSMLGMPRRHFHRLRIENGSLSHVRLAPPDRLRVLSVNQTATLTPLR